jgi:hypothetical protein
MQEPIKYHHVNWIDGMKINKGHFIAFENAVTDRVRDSIAGRITEYNYGLLPVAEEKGSPLKIVLSVDNQKTLRVRLFECRAVTPAGARIEILEGGQDARGDTVPFPENIFEMEEGDTEKFLYVALSVNPFSRIPAGQADPGEDPPRYPSVVPGYSIHLLPAEQMSSRSMGPYVIPVGKIRIADQKPELVKEYIPPCASVRSHPALLKMHAGFDQMFGQLEIDVLKILKKISEKEQSNVLARSVAEMSRNLLYFLSTHILAFRWTIIDEPPLQMLEYIARMARLIRNSIDANSGEAKEELLNYFTDWCNLKQGEFEKTLLNTINFRYEHSEINATAKQMIEFAEVVATLFNKLSILEYIGKKKDTNIFVKEQTGKKSFLAD